MQLSRFRLGINGDGFLPTDAGHTCHDLPIGPAFWLAFSAIRQREYIISVEVMELNPDQQAELDRLDRVLEVAKRNGNQVFVTNIEREIAALERGEQSPLIADYLSEEERSGKRPGHRP